MFDWISRCKSAGADFLLWPSLTFKVSKCLEQMLSQLNFIHVGELNIYICKQHEPVLLNS